MKKENNVKETGKEETFTLKITDEGNETVLKKLKTIFSADQNILTVVETRENTPQEPLVGIESKTFWKTSELKKYGFGRRTLNSLVKKGELTRYDLGGVPASNTSHQN